MRTLAFTSAHGFDASIRLDQLQTETIIHKHIVPVGTYEANRGGEIYQDLVSNLFLLVPRQAIETVDKKPTKKAVSVSPGLVIIRQISLAQPELPPVGTRYGVKGRTWGVLPEKTEKKSTEKPTAKKSTKSTENSARSEF